MPTMQSYYSNAYYRAARIPLIGTYVRRIGYVNQIINFPCNPTPEMWVEAAFQAVPTALFSLIKPNPKDFLTEKFGRSHKRRRKFNFQATAAMYGSAGGTPSPRGAMSWAAFSGVALIERVGWYMTIADIVTGFAVNWTSLAYIYNGCQTPGGGTAGAHVAQGVVVGGADWTRVELWVLDYNNGMLAGSGGVVIQPGQVGAFGYTLIVTPWNDNPLATVVTRLKVTFDDIPQYFYPNVIKNPDGSFAHRFAYNSAIRLHGQRVTYEVEYMKSGPDGSWAYWSGGNYVAAVTSKYGTVGADP